MVILFSIILYVIACFIGFGEEYHRHSERERERRHRELIEAMNAQKKQTELMERKSSTPRVERHILRHIAKDTNGVMYAEERIEEIEQ